MPYVSYNPKKLWQSIMFYAKTHGNKLTKLSYEILAVLAMVKPKNDHDPGNYQIVLEVKNGLVQEILEKQYDIEEIEKNLLEPNTDLDVGISKVVDGKSVTCYQHQIKRFGYGGKNNTTSDLKGFIEEKVLKKNYKGTVRNLTIFLESFKDLDLEEIAAWASDKQFPFESVQASFIYNDAFHFFRFWPYDPEHRSLIVTRREMRLYFEIETGHPS